MEAEESFTGTDLEIRFDDWLPKLLYLNDQSNGKPFEQKYFFHFHTKKNSEREQLSTMAGQTKEN